MKCEGRPRRERAGPTPHPRVATSRSLASARVETRIRAQAVWEDAGAGSRCVSTGITTA